MKQGDKRNIAEEKNRFEDYITIKAKKVSKSGSETEKSDGNQMAKITNC